MTDAQIVAVASRYLDTFQMYEAKRDQEAQTERGRIGHALWMCLQLQGFLQEGKRDKAFRWLGFIQGVLWSADVESIENMKDHNRG